MAKKGATFTVCALIVAVICMCKCNAQSVPPTPTGVTIQFLGTLVVEFKWQAIDGDFDAYLSVYYDASGSEVGSDEIAKTETSFRYLVQDNVAAYSFHTVKGTVRSANAALMALPAVDINIQLPHAVLAVPTHESITISWADAPNPADNVGQYVITLQQPAGTTIDQAIVDAVAGATHTFPGLNVAEEYRVRLDAILVDGLPVAVNIFEDTYTVPYPPSNGILHRTSTTTVTLTWDAAPAPVGYYEIIITPQGGQPRVSTYAPGTTGVMLDNLENGVTYGYTLKNVVNTGNIEIKSDTSDLSLVLPAATGLNPELEAITDHGMHLAWTPSTTQGLQSYRITVLDNAGNAVIVNDIPPTDSSFTLVGLTEGTSYELVLDEIVNGESKYAGVANGITKTPQNVELNGASAHTITVSWNTALTDTADGYLVNVISQDGSYTSLIPVDVASAAAPYTITGLPSGLAYEVGVDAVFAGARLQLGALTDPANTTAPSLIPRVGAITKHGIHLTWTPSTASSLGGYRITLLDSTGKTVRFGPFGASTTSLTLLGLTAGLEYQATFDEVVGEVNTFAGSVEVTTMLPRNVVSHGVTDRTVTVSWDTSLFGAAEGYLISVISKDGSYTRLVPVDVASSGDPYILMLPKAKIYEVGVDAVIDGQRVALGALADPISTDGQPMEISVSVAAVGTDMIQVMWEAYDGATYSLHITNLGNGNTRQIVLPSQATTYTFQELVAGQPYNIMLNIHLNDLDMLSDSINATTRPLPPTDVKIRSCGSYTLIVWGPPPHTPSNIYDGYRIGFVEIDGTMTVKDLPVGRTRLDLPVGYSGTNICLSTISAGRVSQPDPAGPCQSILDF